MLNLTDQFFWEAYQSWFTRCIEKGFTLDCDARFTSDQHIINHIHNEKLKNRGERAKVLSQNAPYFNLIFDELRRSIDEGKMILVTSFKPDNINYYIGFLGDHPSDNTSAVLAYTTRYNKREIGYPESDYTYDELIIIGYPPDEKFDAHFRVSITGISPKIHTKLSNSIMNGMMHDLIYNLYVDKAAEA